MTKSEDKTEFEMDAEEDGVKQAAEDKPSTSELRQGGEGDKKEEQEAEKKAKRASRKQVSVKHDDQVVVSKLLHVTF